MSQADVEKLHNVGNADAMIRLVGGIALLAYGVSGRLGRTGSMLALFLGASKVAEGLTRYCPVLGLFGASSVGVEETIRNRAGAWIDEASIGIRSVLGRDGRSEERSVLLGGESSSSSDWELAEEPLPRDFPWEKKVRPPGDARLARRVFGKTRPVKAKETE